MLPAPERLQLRTPHAGCHLAPSTELLISPSVAGPFCHRSLLTLEEKNVPYSTTLIDFANKPQWLLDVNPAGSVPVMKVRGQAASVSCAAGKLRLHGSQPLRSWRSYVQIARPVLGEAAGAPARI